LGVASPASVGRAGRWSGADRARRNRRRGAPPAEHGDAPGPRLAGAAHLPRRPGPARRGGPLDGDPHGERAPPHRPLARGGRGRLARRAASHPARVPGRGVRRGRRGAREHAGGGRAHRSAGPGARLGGGAARGARGPGGRARPRRRARRPLPGGLAPRSGGPGLHRRGPLLPHRHRGPHAPAHRRAARLAGRAGAGDAPVALRRAGAARQRREPRGPGRAPVGRGAGRPEPRLPRHHRGRRRRPRDRRTPVPGADGGRG